MADIVEDIKSRLGIVEVVSSYVQLKKAGRNYKGLCPFHSEKTPSFVVSPEKQICHCFGCNKGGDIFTFIEEMEGVNFAEALQILADRAGVKVEDFSKFKKKAGKTEKDEFFRAHDLAVEFFEKSLHKSKAGQKVLEYLRKRGLKNPTIKEFRIGFAPDSFDSLYPYLLKKGISKKVLTKSGFVSSKSVASDRIYDKFRGRLMFPIFDSFGRICGFGGRALKKDQEPKYLNSPENLIYNKSKILYGLDKAKKSIKENDAIILVEGYFDVILPYQEGIQNIAATSGTALTPEQAKLIKRFTLNAISCFDSDKAGFEATKRAYQILNAEGIVMKTVKGLNEKDPADFVLEKGAEFKNFIDEAVDFVSFYTDKLLLSFDTGTLEGRREVLKELLPVYKKMTAAIKDFHIRELATKLNLNENLIYDEIDRFKLPTNHPARNEINDSAKEDFQKKLKIEEIICAILLEHPFLFKHVIDFVDKFDFEGELKSVYNELTDQYNSSRDDFDGWDFEKGFLFEYSKRLNVLRLLAEEKYSMFTEEALKVELKKLLDRMTEDCSRKQLNKIREQIKKAEELDKKEELVKLLKKQQDYLEKLKSSHN